MSRRLFDSDLALAFELECAGVDRVHIAAGLGVTEEWLAKRMRKARREGLSGEKATPVRRGHPARAEQRAAAIVVRAGTGKITRVGPPACGGSL